MEQSGFILIGTFVLVGLMRVYIANDRVSDAKAMAGVIVSKEIKVSSPRTIIFMDEARKFLETH